MDEAKRTGLDTRFGLGWLNGSEFDGLMERERKLSAFFIATVYK